MTPYATHYAKKSVLYLLKKAFYTGFWIDIEAWDIKSFRLFIPILEPI